MLLQDVVFTAWCCIFKAILHWVACSYFENAMPDCKHILLKHVATASGKVKTRAFEEIGLFTIKVH